MRASMLVLRASTPATMPVQPSWTQVAMQASTAARQTVAESMLEPTLELQTPDGSMLESIAEHQTRAVPTRATPTPA